MSILFIPFRFVDLPVRSAYFPTPRSLRREAKRTKRASASPAPWGESSGFQGKRAVEKGYQRNTIRYNKKQLRQLSSKGGRVNGGEGGGAARIHYQKRNPKEKGLGQYTINEWIKQYNEGRLGKPVRHW